MTLPDPITLCRDLVRAASPSGAEGAAAAVAAAAMRALDFDDVSVDAWGDVIGIRRGARPGPTVLLDGHLDVVPAADAERWTHDPFGGDVAGGRLWGRGAADTKGALAAQICAAGRLDRERFAGRVVVVASVCEEDLTGAAISHVLGCLRPDVFITGEPSGLRLGTAQKGRAMLLVQAHGRSAHTSRPELGDNAVYRMIEAIGRLRALPLPADPDLGPGVLELTELVSAPLPGNALVPHGCRARFIARSLPGETGESVLERLRGALGGLSGVAIELEEQQQRCYTSASLVSRAFLPGWRRAPGERWGAAILAALQDAGLGAETWAAPCGTNASAAAAAGIPCFIYGPGTLAEAHIVDEWVTLDDLLAAERGFAAILETCLA